MPDTPATQPAAHPTRTAPLCRDCNHFRPAAPAPIQRPAAYCNHPSTPRDPITGNPVVPIADMRARYFDHRWIDLQSARCGLEASLFEPAPLAIKASDGQGIGNSHQPSPDAANLVAKRVLKHDSKLLACTSTDESRHQPGVGGGVALPERPVD